MSMPVASISPECSGHVFWWFTVFVGVATPVAPDRMPAVGEGGSDLILHRAQGQGVHNRRW